MKVCPWPDVIYRLAQVITQVLWWAEGISSACLGALICIPYRAKVYFGCGTLGYIVKALQPFINKNI